MKTVRKAACTSMAFFVAIDRGCHGGDYLITVSLTRRYPDETGYIGENVRLKCGDIFRANLQFSAYVGNSVFGEGLSYNPLGRVNARECKLMAETLTRLERAMTKAAEEYGRVPHFADMVIRLATIMGIDAIRIHESVYAAIGETLPSWGENGAVDCGVIDGASRLRAFIDTLSRMRREVNAKSA